VEIILERGRGREVLQYQQGREYTRTTPVSCECESGQIIEKTSEARGNVGTVKRNKKQSARNSSYRQDLPLIRVCDLIKFVLFDDSLKSIPSVHCAHAVGEDDF